MNPRGQFIEVAARFGLAAIFVVNLVSTVPAAARAPQADEAVQSEPQPRQLPVLEPQYYQPPEIVEPERTTPEADEVPSIVPSKGEIEFYAVATRPQGGNHLMEVHVTVRNHTEDTYTDLIFSDELEAGFEYSPNPISPTIYDSANHRLTAVIESLPPQEEIRFSYFLELTSARQSSLRGRAWLHNVSLSDGASIQLTEPVTIAVGIPVAPGESEIAALRAGEWNALGRVNVHVVEETIGEDAFLVAAPITADTSPTSKGQRGPALQFKLDVYRSSAVTKDEQGRASEQAMSVGQKINRGFDAPAFLEINLDGYVDLTQVPAGQEVYVATYDEENKIWIKVPVLESDLIANTVTVQALHFSTWGAGLGNSLPQNGANVLLFDQPYTSLFTGTSQYSIPIWTPPGRAGMAPQIALSYSSGTLDGVLGDVQGSWVGAGWNIDEIEIVRKITTNDNGYGYINDFALTLNGALYELVQDTEHPNRYFTKTDAFLYVERHNYALSNAKPTTEDLFPPNKTGEWWEVVTRDGTRYRLGWNADSEQLGLMYGYACTTGGNTCTTPDGSYATLGYAGIAKDLVALRWRVDRVMDTHGNYMDYAYYEAQPAGSTTIAAFDRESYLQTISFTGFIDPDGIAPSLSPAYQVKFVTGPRTDYGDVPTHFNVWDNIDSKYLDEIQVCYGDCTPADDDGALIRAYDFQYALANVPNSNGTLKLTAIAMTAGGDPDPVSDQTVPSVTAPTIKFTYQNLDNRASGAGDVFAYPRLSVIENGAGGKLTYTYENDSRGNNSWYNWRVNQVRVENGISTTALQTYAYATPVYSGEGGNPALGSLFGYTNVTETQLDYNNGNAALLATKHTFGTVGLDVGRELITEAMSGSTVLRKTINTYVTDNSAAPFFGWNNRFLYQSISSVRSGSNLVVTSQTRYNRDAETGNLLIRSDYLGTSLYRKTYYEYLINADPAYNIIDKASRVLVVTAANSILSDTRYHYDGQIARAPSKGELTLTQVRTGSGSQTVDTRTHYDIYGNVDQTNAYEVYGSVNVDPSGTSIESRTVFDGTVHTFPIQTINPMGWTAAASYIYTLGVPYQTTDVNSWVTTTKYDGIGRTLSVTPPGLAQAGVIYQYPVPDGTGKLNPPYSVEMQILDTIAQKHRSVWAIYDGLGRTIQTQVYDDSNSQLLVTNTSFNAQGLTSRQSLPFYVSAAGGNYTYSSAPQNTDTTYDVLGRPLTVTQPGNIVSTTSYDGLITTSLDPNGNKMVRTTDGLGRLAYVVEYMNGSSYATTTYSNDQADRLTDVTDAQSNHTEIEYNWLGHKTVMDDPDMGVWTYTYFPTGAINTQTDARACVTTFAYDDLGRMTSKSFSGTTGICDTTTGSTYTYDPIGMKGARSAMTDGSGSSTSWSYTNYGRTVTETRGSTALTTASDWLGRPITLTYPDNDVVTYAYDSLGRPDSMTSSDNSGVTLANLAYNALGQITSNALGNGVTITNTYNSSNNRLTSRTASSSLLNLSYTYDASGNILTLTDSILSETHTYQYDSLNRLISAEALNGSTYVYRQQFEYDKVGNINQVNNWITPTPQGFMPSESLRAQGTGGEGEAVSAVAEPALQPVVYHPPTRAPAEVRVGPAAPQFDVPTNTPHYTSTVSQTPTLTPSPIYDGDTDTLLKMDGSDGSTTFTDATGLHTWTANGNVQIDIAQSQYGGSSGLFDGSGDYLTTPDHDDFYFNGDFTMDFWARFNALPTGGNPKYFYSQVPDANNRYNFGVVYNSPGLYALCFESAAAYVILVSNCSGTFSLATGTWYHVALVKSGTTYYYFLNGVLKGSSTDSDALPNLTGNVVIGQYANNYFINGWLDEFQISKGVARWTSNFTPPGQPTATPTYTPTSTNTPTPSNTPNPTTSLKAYWSIDTASGTSAPDSAGTNNSATLYNGTVIGTNGASDKWLSFDGSNHYASIAHHADLVNNGSFTLSAWINPSSIVADRTQFIIQKGGTAKDYGFITLSSSGTPTPTSTPAGPVTVAAGSFAFEVGDLTPNKILGPTLPINTWTFVAGVYDSAAQELRLYIDGQQVANTKVTGTVAMSNGVLTFSSSSTSNVYQGGLDEVRFHNAALTTSQIQALYALATPPPTSTMTPSPTGATSTPTPSSTPLAGSQSPWGNGADGDMTVNTGVTYNISTQNSGSRTCADGGDAVAYSLTSLGSTVAVLSATPSSGCLNAGDEVMLINMQGSSTSTYNTGVYEFLRVSYVTGNSVVFTDQKVQFYGTGYRSDAGIGIGAGQQHVMLVRVPNYEDVTINGTLTANAWDGLKYGTLVIRASQNLTGSGTISASGLGFRGAASSTGEGPSGYTGALAGGAGSTSNNCGNTRPGGGGHVGKGGNTGGGNPYGVAPLAQIFMGAGGGAAETAGQEGEFCGGGTRGGGIVLLAGQTINFSGGIASNGSNNNMGAGAGGSIRIEGYNVTLNTAAANGGTSTNLGAGSAGRIAIYYQNSLTGGYTSTPSAYAALLGTAPTATPSPTAINLTPTPPPTYGTGQDGNLTVATATTFNMHTNFSGARNCADGISYAVVQATETFVKLSSSPAAGCLATGDEVLLINLRGTGTKFGNVGVFEFLRIGGIIGDTVYFTTNKQNYYGEYPGGDANIGTGAGQQRVMLMRVPNYNNITVNGTLTGSGFNDTINGLIVFRASGTVSGTGTITMSGLGYRGGSGLGGSSGEGPLAYSSAIGGGGPGYASGCTGARPGGGGHEVEGGGNAGAGGEPYGVASLERIYFGAGGGPTGTTGQGGTECSNGGGGGGTIILLGQTIDFDGTITSNGGNSAGAGAGGSILIQGYDVALNTASVTGGTSGNLAPGSVGRIAVYYQNSYSANFSPGYLTQNGAASTATPTVTVTATGLVDGYTKALLHMDGTNGSTTFTDQAGRTWTAGGNAYINTAQYKFGTASGRFDGYFDYVSAADSPDFDFGSGDFTIDFWVRFNAFPAAGTLDTLFQQTLSSGQEEWFAIGTSNGTTYYLQFYASDGTSTINVSSPATSWSTGTWYHVALVRSGSSFMIFRDGALLQTATNSQIMPDIPTKFEIGGNGGNPLNGWVDDFRISKGIARWTSAFATPAATSTPAGPTPTTAPPSNPGTTNLVSWWTLNEASGTRNDSHSSNHLNAYGTGGVTSAAGKQGSAADFESSEADFLEINDNASLSTGDIDFTVAAWIKLESLPGASQVVILSKNDGASGAAEYTLSVATDKLVEFEVYSSTATLIGNVKATNFGALSTDTWYFVTAHHDAANNVVSISVNNGLSNTAATTGVPSDSTGNLRIGARNATESNFFDGLIDEAAFYKRVLTAGERTWLYNSGAGRSYTDLNPPAPQGWESRAYAYATDIPHAVTSVTKGAQTDTYSYDANGNMTCRVEAGVSFIQKYNAENRTSSIIKLETGTCASPGNYAGKWDFAYDGDGVRTATLYTPYASGSPGTPVLTTYYFGGIYEQTGTLVDQTFTLTSSRKYYAIAGQSVAMKEGSTLSYFLTDHLGSTMAVVNSSGAITQQQRYLPFGQVRTVSGSSAVSATDYGYTFQRNLADMGLMDYKARFYSPTLGRFTQPDTIIPSIENPQDWNRYSYVLGNPIRYADPTGHCACALLALLAGGAIATVAAQVIVVTLVAIAVGVAVGLIVNALTASTPVSMMGRKEHNRGIYYPKPATVDFNIDPRRPDPGRNDQKETSEEAEATKAACRSRNLGVCLVIGGLSLASTVAESTGNSFEPNPAENKKPVVQASRYTANPRVGGRQIYYDDPSIRDRRFETD